MRNSWENTNKVYKIYRRQGKSSYWFLHRHFCYVFDSKMAITTIQFHIMINSMKLNGYWSETAHLFWFWFFSIRIFFSLVWCFLCAQTGSIWLNNKIHFTWYINWITLNSMEKHKKNKNRKIINDDVWYQHQVKKGMNYIKYSALQRFLDSLMSSRLCDFFSSCL